MSLQYGERGPTGGWDLLAILGQFVFIVLHIVLHINMPNSVGSIKTI